MGGFHEGIPKGREMEMEMEKEKGEENLLSLNWKPSDRGATGTARSRAAINM